jgi:hypothetical protein
MTTNKFEEGRPGSAETRADRLQALPREGRRIAKIQIYERLFSACLDVGAKRVRGNIPLGGYDAGIPRIAIRFRAGSTGPTDRVFKNT